ncbi:MAG TPA: hypothetical protein VHR66_22410 [Gemmataceae bacterium]|nr:hypothetical protein [Gemmataceae bacterium]
MTTIPSATRTVAAKQVEILSSLKPGQRIRVAQTVRVGAKKWQATTTGAFRHLNFLATGVTTDRVPEDDVVVPVVHFVKDNGELSSITLDENTVVEMV